MSETHTEYETSYERTLPRRGLHKVGVYTPAREKMMDLIAKHPGISASALSRLMGYQDARSAQHHIHILVSAGLIHYEGANKHRNHLYYGGTLSPRERMLRNLGSTRRVLEHIQRAGSATMEDLKRDLKLTQGNARFHIDKLRRLGLVRVEAEPSSWRGCVRRHRYSAV